MYTYVVYLGSAFPFYLGEFRTEKAAMNFIENERHGRFGYEREKALEYISAADKVETDNIYEMYLKQNVKFR